MFILQYKCSHRGKQRGDVIYTAEWQPSNLWMTHLGQIPHILETHTCNSRFKTELLCLCPHASQYLHHESVGVTLPQESRVCCKVLLLWQEWERRWEREQRERWSNERKVAHVSRNGERFSYRCQDAAAPDEWEQVERGQLSGLVELAVFGFGQVQPPVNFLKGWGRKYEIDFHETTNKTCCITPNQYRVDIAK